MGMRQWYASRGLVACRQCGGHGIIPPRHPEWEVTAECGHCDGTGEEPKADDPPPTR